MALPAEGLWALWEIMGHRRHFGLGREETIVGVVMLRIDVPGPNPGDPPKATHHYGGGSIFGITACTEEYARREANPPEYRPAAYQLSARDDEEVEPDEGTTEDEEPET